jgi:hypothetical protein
MAFSKSVRLWAIVRSGLINGTRWMGVLGSEPVCSVSAKGRQNSRRTVGRATRQSSRTHGILTSRMVLWADWLPICAGTA